MVKPVKKRQSSDPNIRAHQLMAQMEAKQASGPEKVPADVSAYMAKIGSKGGKIGGKRRLKTMTSKERKAIAAKGGRKKAENARRRARTQN